MDDRVTLFTFGFQLMHPIDQHHMIL
jgi:hypothetical protein